MTGRNFDTDPSTPGAIRGGTTADTDPLGAAAEPRKPNTDPGLGPAAPPAAAGPSPVRVPPAGRQDSVEMLLDGMSAPQPERQKMTPQSAGEAAASYHAEHPVHPARTSPDEEPKVIVERPPLAPTVRVQREKLQAVIEQADALRRAREAEEAAEQAPVPVTLGPKVLIAAVAGLVVVLVIFVVARGKSAGTESGKAGGAGTTATATATTAAAATATATAAGTAIPVADTTAATAVAPAPTAHVPISALPAAPATAPAATAKPRPRPNPTATSGDLGEFKTTFH